MRVASLVGLESRIDYLRDLIVFTLVVDGKVEQSHSHASFIEALELTQSFQKKVVHIGAVVPDVDQNFPWL